jgi:hypothetical protein
MKTFLASLVLAAAALGLAGCESDMPPNPHEENPIQRGLRGEGQLIQPDAQDDGEATGTEIPRPNN